MTEKTFTQSVVEVILNIPKGKVASYGQVAGLVGNPRAARQVVRVLHSSSRKEGLPWHRIINSKGMISLTGEGYDLQRSLLEAEGVVFDENGKVNLEVFRWDG
ncbi:MAG: MGMT family protein [bacterium]|nr:MGMT family protein [bacterium]